MDVWCHYNPARGVFQFSHTKKGDDWALLEPGLIKSIVEGMMQRFSVVEGDIPTEFGNVRHFAGWAPDGITVVKVSKHANPLGRGPTGEQVASAGGSASEDRNPPRSSTLRPER